MAKKKLIEAAKAEPDQRPPITPDAIFKLLKKKHRTTAELAAHFQVADAEMLEHIGKLHEHGYLLCLFGDKWGAEKKPPQGIVGDHVYESRKDDTYLFGFASDNHLGSKYERLDVLHDLYDWFAAAGVDCVYNAGNWIDGEARFNKHDLHVHGMDQQILHLAESYPQREGIVTYAVAGDDHEGWYGQREGIDIGRHAERIMREQEREDWSNLGYMECFVPLRNLNSGKECRMLVVHPGGGSSYAISYKPQKIIEAFEGGEKPSAMLVGHYHKMSYQLTRNVHAIQCGCTQDQTPFMRKRGIQAHIGGGICRLGQDPRTGALTRCQVEFFNYYNKGYYNNRWSHGGKVTLPQRVDKKKKPRRAK